MNAYEETIVELSDREAARETFTDWCEMLASVHDEVEFMERQNDVATLHIETKGTHIARDLLTEYGVRGRNPLRVTGLKAVDADRVAVEILLAELHSSE